MRANRPGAKGNRGKTTHGANGIRGETTHIQRELTPTAFRLVLSAGKLNLPLVPSHDYVLQDNKRCYNKILSDWSGILFSGVTSLPLTTTSRPSLGGENQI